MSSEEIILALQKENAELRNLVETLRREIATLQERLNKNSRNSSKPPSSDGLAKPKPSSLREKSGKKPGAQKGHPGHGLSLVDMPTETIVHKPEQCAGCANYGICESCAMSPARNVVDVEISTKVTRHYTGTYACPLLNGKLISGEFPIGVTSGLQYGAGVRALAIALNTGGMMSVERVHEILKGVLGVPISSGTVSNMVSRFGATIGNTAQEIREALLNAPVVNCDETGTRVNGAICWLHSACNENYTWLSVQSKRGREGMEKAGFLPSYTGTIIHDCWAPYWSFEKLEHGLCGAHLLRELQGIIDNNPRAAWAKSMQSLLKEMNQLHKESVANGETEIQEAMIGKFKKRYSIILGKARQRNPVERNTRGRPKRSKARALIDRLTEHKDQVCRCLSNLLAPFTNNLAEQSIRMMKVKTKVSGCFRTFSGAETFAAIMTYLHTAMKRGIPAYTAIRNALAGESHSTIFTYATQSE